METFAGIGGLAAVTFLVVTCSVFAALSRLLGAAASGFRLTVAQGIVNGMRAWEAREETPDGQPPRPEPVTPWEDLPPGTQLGAE